MYIGFFSFILGTALSEREFYKTESDEERRERYQLEQINLMLTSNQDEAFHMTELTERNRIAQQLHDNVGHELTGAVLGLQVLDEMIKKHDLSNYEREMFNKVKNRINNSSYILRQTVHNMKPYVPQGLEDLKSVVASFDNVPIDLKLYGNVDSIPPYYWVLLKTALKEGLTNALKHSKANSIKAQIDITNNILRFSLENDGANFNSNRDDGIGIRSLRQRAKTFGGTLSCTKITDEGRFLMTIVLPLYERRH